MALTMPPICGAAGPIMSTPGGQGQMAERSARLTGRLGRRQVVWSMGLPFLARALVLTPEALLVAGGKSLTETAEHHGPGTLIVASREGGEKRDECTLPAPPVLDGMAYTSSGVFVSLIDGSVVCVRGQ